MNVRRLDMNRFGVSRRMRSITICARIKVTDKDI
jgi:hypothetical protein